MNSCKFCERVINNKGSLASHELVCKHNLHRTTRLRSQTSDTGDEKRNILSGCHEEPHTTKDPYSDTKFSLDKVLVKDSTYPRRCIKRRIIEHDIIPYVCNICSQEPIWNGKPLVLILDHRNGINNDNRLENLRFVCSNCDSQLSTYKSKNRKSKTNRKSQPKLVSA